MRKSLLWQKKKTSIDKKIVFDIPRLTIFETAGNSQGKKK
jgi:hypothetical protein